MQNLVRILSVVLISGGAALITVAKTARSDTYEGLMPLYLVMAFGVGLTVAGMLLLVLIGLRNPPPG